MHLLPPSFSLIEMRAVVVAWAKRLSPCKTPRSKFMKDQRIVLKKLERLEDKVILYTSYQQECNCSDDEM